MFQEGTIAWIAQEIGRLQGRLDVSDDWAKLNGGFQIIAPPHKQKIEDQIDRYKLRIVKLREGRAR